MQSRITVRPYKKLDNEEKIEAKLVLKLYSEGNNQHIQTTIKSSLLNNGIELKTIFPNSDSFLRNSFGWLTIFSEYPFFDITGTIENEFSISYEYAF